MRIKRYYFQSGEFAGILIFWNNWRYRTYIHRERGWKGHWRSDLPRWFVSKPWWHRGSLMLIDSRICWDTQLWIRGPQSYTVTNESIADNLYGNRSEKL